MNKRKKWVSYQLYFKECRHCKSMIMCLKYGKECLKEERNE